MKLSFIFNGSIGRKSYLPIDRGHVLSRARVEKQKLMKSRNCKLFHTVIAIIGLAFVSSGSSAFAQQAQSQVMNTTTSDTQEAPKLSSGELDSLVAPIALYPDPLLAQTLAASTYPLEIIQLQQWMDRNKNLQGKASGGRSGKAVVGPKRPVTGRISRRSAADGRQCPMDDGFGERIPRTAI